MKIVNASVGEKKIIFYVLKIGQADQTITIIIHCNMTQEEKKLLLKDICGRLCYGIFVKENRESLDDGPTIYTLEYHLCIDACKPYLRPMSSMTEEEKEFIKYRWCYDDWTDIHDFLNNYKIDAIDARDFIDWLNKNMFDYRGLIPMGLALEAPEGMYN